MINSGETFAFKIDLEQWDEGHAHRIELQMDPRPNLTLRVGPRGY